MSLRAGAGQDAIRFVYREHVRQGTEGSEFFNSACDLCLERFIMFFRSVTC